MRNKKSKSNPIHFGIEVTKPHSKEMYTHNDKIAEELKSNILKAWRLLIKNNMHAKRFGMSTDWSRIDEDSNLVKLQKNVMYSGYGDGYTIDDVHQEFYNELEMMANWQLHEVYSHCCFEGLVPRTKQGMVGFDWEKMNYWTDQIESKLDIIKRIAGDDLRWSSHADVDGNVTKHPYIKVYNSGDGQAVVNNLLAFDIDAELDCYEADDGDDEYTLTRQLQNCLRSNKKDQTFMLTFQGLNPCQMLYGRYMKLNQLVMMCLSLQHLPGITLKLGDKKEIG